MPHPLRRWIKNTLEYGRRSSSSPGDAKPPLFWLADFPRLTVLWADILFYRARKDLRATPPRVVFDPKGQTSPHIRSIRPTKLNPARPLRALGVEWARFEHWLSEGGHRTGRRSNGGGDGRRGGCGRRRGRERADAGIGPPVPKSAALRAVA